MRLVIGLVSLLLSCGCFVGGRSDRPTLCDPNDPRGADPSRFLRCGASQTCVLDGEDQSTCVDLVSDKSEGQPCAYANECAAGLVCSSLGFCAKSCSVGTATCAGACLAFTDGVHLEGATYGMCVGPTCDPTNPSNGAAGFTPCDGSCRFLDTSTACFPAPPGSGGDGAACATDIDCGQAFVCASGACKRVCADDAACAQGTTCTRAQGVTSTVNGVAYGYCG
jgi:hypothetical protein